MAAMEHLICPLSAIPQGEGRSFNLGGEHISVFRARSGGVYAVQAECPHRGGPLADGLVGGTTVICPLHGWKFDLTDGRALLGNCSLKTYPVRVDDEDNIRITHT